MADIVKNIKKNWIFIFTFGVSKGVSVSLISTLGSSTAFSSTSVCSISSTRGVVLKVNSARICSVVKIMVGLAVVLGKLL